MKKVIAVLSAITVLAAGTVLVIGQSTDDKQTGKRFGQHGKRGNFGGMKHRRGNMMGRMFRQLELTDDQKTQMKAIRQTSRESMKPIMQQMREGRKSLGQLTSNGSFDEAQVQAIAAQQGTLHAQMIVEKERTKAAMLAVLTPEQKAKLDQIRANQAQRRADMKAKWKGKKKADKSESQ